jgi:hypothetical protein
MVGLLRRQTIDGWHHAFRGKTEGWVVDDLALCSLLTSLTKLANDEFDLSEPGIFYFRGLTRLSEDKDNAATKVEGEEDNPWTVKWQRGFPAESDAQTPSAQSKVSALKKNVSAILYPRAVPHSHAHCLLILVGHSLYERLGQKAWRDSPQSPYGTNCQT